MLGVIACWVIAMISGFWWSSRWTGVWTAVTSVLFVSTQTTALAHGSGWLQFGVLVGTPWLLASGVVDALDELKVAAKACA